MLFPLNRVLNLSLGELVPSLGDHLLVSGHLGIGRLDLLVEVICKYASLIGLHCGICSFNWRLLNLFALFLLLSCFRPCSIRSVLIIYIISIRTAKIAVVMHQKAAQDPFLLLLAPNCLYQRTYRFNHE